MHVSEMTWFPASEDGDAATRSALRRQMEAFAWDLLSRLAGVLPDEQQTSLEKPLDTSVARG
jgi:hypothetical protein